MEEGQVNKNNMNRLLHFEDCAHAIDQLFRSALKKQGADAFNEFLGFAEKFNNL
jgi:hypothetical protein